MRDGFCPRCKSHQVFFNMNELGEVKQHARRVETMDYICVDCRYFERYITDKEALGKIPVRAEKLGDWRKVG